ERDQQLALVVALDDQQVGAAGFQQPHDAADLSAFGGDDRRADQRVLVELVFFKFERVGLGNDQATTDQLLGRRHGIGADKFQDHAALVEPVAFQLKRPARVVWHPHRHALQLVKAFGKIGLDIASDFAAYTARFDDAGDDDIFNRRWLSAFFAHLFDN